MSDDDNPYVRSYIRFVRFSTNPFWTIIAIVIWLLIIFLALAAQAQPNTSPAQFVSTTSDVVAIVAENATIGSTNRRTERLITAPAPIPDEPPMPFTSSTNAATFSLSWLMFDGPPNVTNFVVYVVPIANTRYLVEPGHQYGPTIGISYVVGVSVATNFETFTNRLQVPHLLYGQLYWIKAQSKIGTNLSDLSPALAWPPARITYDPLTIQQTSDFTNWTTTYNSGVVITSRPNENVYYRMVAARTNNVDPFQIRE